MHRLRTLSLTLLLAGVLAGTGQAALMAQVRTTPIADIQRSVTNGDDSTFVGQTVTVEGIVTGVYGSLFFVQEAAGGPWNGIAVYQRNHGTSEGDVVRITGVVAEYYDLTQIEPTAIEILSSNNPLPAPARLTASAAAREEWESVFVRLDTLTVSAGPDTYGEWRVRDVSGSLRVDDKGVAFAAQPGQEIASITAIVDHAFGSYRLIPRRLSDIAADAPTSTTVVPPAELTPIFTIQGDGTESPLRGQDVSVLGVVTGVGPEGFYLQDPTGDDNPATSDGIYVYLGRRPGVAAGDCVLVRRALVSEFYEKTELSEVGGVSQAEGCALPGPTASPAPLPQRHITPTAIFEPLEGMLVSLQILTGTVQGPTKRFASGDVEIALTGEGLSPYLPAGRVWQEDAGEMAGLIFLSGGIGAALPDAAWGDRVSVHPASGDESVLAVVDYNFGKYQLLLLPASLITVEAGNAVADSLPSTAEDSFTVCTFNLYALGRGRDQYPLEADYQQHLHKRATTIAEGLRGCTIIGVQETGTPTDAHNLAQLLTDKFALPYTAVAIEGPNSSDPDFPLTNSLLVRTDQVTVTAALSSQGCSGFDFGVESLPDACPPRQFPFFNRPPLVVDVEVTGPWGDPYPLTVIVNHWKSKSGDESVNLVRRVYQAQHVADLVQNRLDVDPDAHVVVLGDLNDFYTSAPVRLLQELTSPALIQGFDHVSPADRYTYIFNGGSQVLDYILYSRGMQDEFAGIDPLHINADFPVYAEMDPTTVYHASDHDPVVLTVRPGGAGWVGGTVLLPEVTIELLDESGAVAAQTTSDGLGEFRLWGIRPGRYSLRYAPPVGTNVETDDAVFDVQPGAGLTFRPIIRHRQADLGVQAAIAGAALVLMGEK